MRLSLWQKQLRCRHKEGCLRLWIPAQDERAKSYISGHRITCLTGVFHLLQQSPHDRRHPEWNPACRVRYKSWLAIGVAGVISSMNTLIFSCCPAVALPYRPNCGAVKTSPDKLGNIDFALCLTAGLMGTYLIALLAGLFVFKHGLRASTMQALVCAFPDMAYFGAPILATVIGPTGFLAVLVGNLITSMIMLPLTIMLTQASDKTEGQDKSSTKHIFATSLWDAVKNPIVWLPVLGALLSFAHLPLPEPIMSSADMVAKAAGGASLFALGLMFYGERPKISVEIIANLGMKNFLQPLFMLLGAMALGLTGSLMHQAVITGAVPTATAASMFTLRNQVYTAETSALLFS